MIRSWFNLLIPEHRRELIPLALASLGMGVVEMAGLGVVVSVLLGLFNASTGSAIPFLGDLLDSLRGWSPAALLGMLVGVYLLKSLVASALLWWQASFGLRLAQSTSQRLFSRGLGVRLEDHLRQNSTDFLSVTVAESMHLGQLSTAFLRVVSEICVVVLLIVLMLLAEPISTVMALLVIGSMALISDRVSRRFAPRWGAERLQVRRRKVREAQEAFGAFTEILLFDLSELFSRRFGQLTDREVILDRRLTFAGNVPRYFLEAGVVLVLGVVVLIGISSGTGTVDLLPTIGLFAAGSLRLAPATHFLLNSLTAIRQLGPTVEKLEEEFGRDSIRVTDEASRAVPAEATAIEFRDVTFSYSPEEPPVFSNLCLKLPLGEQVGIIGPSGSGKSTLLHLLLGTLEPTEGDVQIGGSSLRSIRRAWQSSVGYVSQSVYLLDASIRSNVALGREGEEVDDDEVWAALRAANLSDQVEGLPLGLDTRVGERGARLSGGQIQRIGIARALFRHPTVLVLDEATSALDVDTEREVIDVVSALGGRTVFIVAHRESAVAHCGTLVRLEESGVARVLDSNSAD